MTPHCFSHLVFSFLLSGMMSFIISGVATLRAVGLVAQLPLFWVTAWPISWSVSFPTVLVIAPLAGRFAGALVKPAAAGGRHG
ncbi:MAG: DUF2798 domain-containing protein [Albidovulum sp.]|uniref:DUF2798 domain-containing protein n=1 Tax=Albidovulum sp. TaxID=1872424 RepID=UPI0030523CC1